MPHLEPGQQRRNRMPQVGYAEHCCNCDNPMGECRCGEAYVLVRTDENWMREFIRVARPLHSTKPLTTNTLHLAEAFTAPDALELMEYMNGDIYDQRHQWGLQHI